MVKAFWHQQDEVSNLKKCNKVSSVSSSKYVAMLFYIEFVGVKTNLFPQPVTSAALLLHTGACLEGVIVFLFLLLK